MNTTVDKIAPDTFRISTWIPGITEDARLIIHRRRRRRVAQPG